MEPVWTGGSEGNIYEVTSSSPSSNSTEFNLDEFLKTNLGSRSRDVSGSVALTVVYGVIFVTGLLGNACTCVVIATNKHLHNATNFYLFSLAISDLVMLILGQYVTMTLTISKRTTVLHTFETCLTSFSVRGIDASLNISRS